MAATKTQNIEATVRQVELLDAAGADIVRIAVDSRKDVEALAEVRGRTSATLSVDLQENYRLAEIVAPHVDKVRYNPGHLWHHEREKPVRDKVAFLAEVAERHDCAIRVGVNCGSVDPVMIERFGADDVGAMVESALEHCAMLDDLGSPVTSSRSRTPTGSRSSRASPVTSSRSRTPTGSRSSRGTAASRRSAPTCPCTSA